MSLTFLETLRYLHTQQPNVFSIIRFFYPPYFPTSSYLYMHPNFDKQFRR